MEGDDNQHDISGDSERVTLAPSEAALTRLLLRQVPAKTVLSLCQVADLPINRQWVQAARIAVPEEDADIAAHAARLVRANKALYAMEVAGDQGTLEIFR